MPKERQSKPSSFDRATVSPYGRGVNVSDSKSSLTAAVQEKEWEEARCPICMEIPHNAVLLICSSQNCRPFICDTSPRHSNCLDQFRKSPGGQQDGKLVCPMCRGAISTWTVVQEARKLMDAKTRSCTLETCDFSGNYIELRKHARREHPSVHPSEVSPTRLANWAELQRQRDLEDVFAHQYIDSEWMDGIPSTPTPLLWGEEGSFDFITDDELIQRLDSIPPTTPTSFWSVEDESSLDFSPEDESYDSYRIFAEFSFVSSGISRLTSNTRRLISNPRINSTVVASPSLSFLWQISPSTSRSQSPSQTSRDESRSRRSNNLNSASPYSRGRPGYLSERRNRSSSNQRSRDESSHWSSYDLNNAGPSSNSRNRSPINQTSRDRSSHRSFSRSTRNYDLSNANQSSNSRSRSSINQTSRDGSRHRNYPRSTSSRYHNFDTSSNSRNRSSRNPTDRNPTYWRD